MSHLPHRRTIRASGGHEYLYVNPLLELQEMIKGLRRSTVTPRRCPQYRIQWNTEFIPGRKPQDPHPGRLLTHPAHEGGRDPLHARSFGFLRTPDQIQELQGEER